jgi:uncharacterized damage-inducible protein DinB
MLLDHLQDLYDYNYWAWDRILNACEALTPEQFLETSDYPHGGLRDTLVHAFFAEWLWRRRCMGESPQTGEKLIDPADYPDLASLRLAWTKEEQAMQAYLQTLTEDLLAGTLKYKTTKGDPYEDSMLGILTHVVFHGMQHRAEAAQMLTRLGHSPGNIDLIIYLRGE